MKIWFLLALLLLLPTISNAQTKIKFGFRAGINYSNNFMTNKGFGAFNGDREYRVSYHAGVLTNIPLAGKFSVTPELLFSSKGYSANGNSTSSSRGNVYFDYISLPVLLNFTPIEKLSLSFGPEFAYLLSAKTKVDTETTNLPDWWKSLGFEANRIDIGLGIGVALNLNNEVAIGIRYFHGLSSVVGGVRLTANNGNPIPPEDASFENRTFQFSIAYFAF